MTVKFYHNPSGLFLVESVVFQCLDMYEILDRWFQTPK